jgi:lipoprotein-anchoring transpeptidase ErfK/SrfK
MRVRQRWIGVLVGSAVTALAVVALVVTAGLFAGTPAAPGTPRTPATTTSTAPTGATAPAGSTLVATTDGSIPGYPAPGAPSDTTVPGSWWGYPSVLPVIASTPGWLEVRLAQRPNGSTTWVQQSQVTLGSTPYAIVVNLSTMHLTVDERGTQILDFPAGIGAPADPTPPGSYFVTMQYPAPSPAYGPFVLVTSDHSDTIADWENTGDAVIAIHGPITSYDDSLIGTTGAAISNGCIRLHDADLAQLAMIPAGTPVTVVA